MSNVYYLPTAKPAKAMRNLVTMQTVLSGTPIYTMKHKPNPWFNEPEWSWSDWALFFIFCCGIVVLLLFAKRNEGLPEFAQIGLFLWIQFPFFVHTFWRRLYLRWPRTTRAITIALIVLFIVHCVHRWVNARERLAQQQAAAQRAMADQVEGLRADLANLAQRNPAVPPF